VYVSAWLKCHYPAAFCAALLNSQPMGFYAPAQLVRNAREHGVEVLKVDVNRSAWDCDLERMESEAGVFALRLGLRQILGLPEAAGRAIEAARRDGPFVSITDFSRRTSLSPALVSKLAAADAFESLALDRRGALWQALAVEPPSNALPLLDTLAPEDEALVSLPEMPQQEEVFADYRTTELSLRKHPMVFHREWLSSQQISPAEALEWLPKNRMVRVAGLVLVRQRPGTAKGITFVTLEDETGVANLIIRPDVWQKYYRPARTASALVAHGRLQREHGVIHVLVTKLEDLSERLAGMRSQSRDFH
jgi:error-prone DNA polymerase